MSKASPSTSENVQSTKSLIDNMSNTLDSQIQMVDVLDGNIINVSLFDAFN